MNKYRINFKAVQNVEDVIRLLSIVYSNNIFDIPNEFYKALDSQGLSHYFTLVIDENNKRQEEGESK